MTAPAATSSSPPKFRPDARAVDHYENFPVASWLCPPALRPAVAAIYWFARTADDLADEGDAPAQARLADLAHFRADLLAVAAGQSPSGCWPQVFGPLAVALERHRLPVRLLDDLLSAFEQDVRFTAAGRRYRDRDELLDYCSRSANPVGRLLLHLYGVTDAQALARSDAICSALQLINFWQDLSVDLPRGRCYLPESELLAHGLTPDQPAAWPAHPNATALIAAQADWARLTMQKGMELVHQLPGRAGWELRLVVQGGLRILDKLARHGFDSFHRRHRLGPADALPMAWGALWM